MSAANFHDPPRGANPHPNAAPPPSSSEPRPRCCWATLLTKGDHYLPGLVVFAHSLLRGKNGTPEGVRGGASRYPLVVMATEDLSERAEAVIRQVGCEIVKVDYLVPKVLSKNPAEARFLDVWTKLRAFELTDYERVVLVDSDMLVMRNMDELMRLELLPGQEIAASHACTCNPAKVASYPPEWTPENCAFTTHVGNDATLHPPQLTASSKPTHRLLNSGLVVLHPSIQTMRSMLDRLDSDASVESMRFPDQDFLASYFEGRWMVIGWCYNALKKLRQVHPELWKDDEVRNVHYILNKPWVKPVPRTDPDFETHSWWWRAWHALADDGEDDEGGVASSNGVGASGATTTTTTAAGTEGNDGRGNVGAAATAAAAASKTRAGVEADLFDDVVRRHVHEQ